MTEKQLENQEKQRQQGIKTLYTLNPEIKILEYKNSKAKAKFQCLKCERIFEITPDSLKRRKGRCPYCENLVRDNKKASISEVRPDLKNWFVNKKDFYDYGINSKRIVQLKCPDCGFEFQEKIFNFTARVHLCPNCYLNDISRPNKFLRAFLEEIKDQLLQKDLEWNPSWGEKYVWDGHMITKDNIEVVIEMQGEQHYHETNWGRHDYQLKRDSEKRELCKKVNIEQIEIDCSNTKYSFMQKQILNSRLSEILDLTQVRWENIFINSSKNYIKVVAEYYNDGKSSGEIGKILDMDRHTIQKMLINAKEIGWINYESIPVTELSKKDTKITDVLTRESIIIHRVIEACKWFKEKYGIPVDRHTIRDYIRGERIIYYGGKHTKSLKRKLYKNRFKFEYIEKDETSNKANG